MKVIFKTKMQIAGKIYQPSAEPQEMQDRLAHNQVFKALVKSGAVIVPPKSDAEIKLQAMKDTDAAQKALDAVKGD